MHGPRLIEPPASVVSLKGMAMAASGLQAAPTTPPFRRTFYRDILPILQDRCQLRRPRHFNLMHPNGRIESLRRVNCAFHWQLSYRLQELRPLKAGAELEAVAWYDNSRHNPHNPDPDRAVTWGNQTDDEIMVDFFDVAVPATMDKGQFFAQRYHRSP